MIAQRNLVVVGNGMVGHRFVERCVAAGLHFNYAITVLGEERQAAYDRVNLSKVFEGKAPEELSMLATPDWYQVNGISLILGDKAAAIDREARTVTTASGKVVSYDSLVLATGSFPFVPPVPGKDGPGCLVYRTLDDLDAIRAAAQGGKRGVVIGGGLLGLECANAVKNLGLETHVVEFAPRLMTVQVDDAGGALLKAKIETLGVKVHLNKSTTLIARDAAGKVEKLIFADKTELPTDMVVFSAGIRPRDDLARGCGLPVGERGGIVVDDRCVTPDPHILAIGEVACWKGRTYGLVAPGYHMAQVACDVLAGAAEPAMVTGFDMSTKLKLLGVEVGSFGDAFATTKDAQVVAFTDTTTGVYRKLVLSPDRGLLLGGVLVGDTSAYGMLHQFMLGGVAMPPNPEDMILPSRSGSSSGPGVGSLPDSAGICSCHNVSKGAIVSAISGGCQEVGAIMTCTKAGTGCGSCKSLLKDILHVELKKSGVTVTNHVCEHFAHSRQELYSLVRLHGIHSFSELIAAHGKGDGCEICKPAVASILASAWNEHILTDRHAHLQDTNDRYLANMQKDGTYSVVPRCPGGEITPDQLIALGQVAKKYKLYSKITGGQRVDLFGAHLGDLPTIWKELQQVGFESGHAYGKALRTVKSCVGSTWCRYGVQDAVGLAVKVEHRYKGLRSPHKLKSAVSGCARECAEAQGKDFGIIATEKGYNLYVCGNGGMTPQHGVLLAQDLSEEQVLTLCDRFLMFYIRTADRHERTAPWFNKLEGGLDFLKSVLIDDSLHLVEQLDREMQHIVDTYQDEWCTAIEDPALRSRFSHFVNSDRPDPTVVMVSERTQHRPAAPHEKPSVIPTLVPV